MEILEKIAEALYKGDSVVVKELTQHSLDQGIAPEKILADGLIQGMDVVGVDFKDGTLFIPEVLMAAQSMHAGMAILKPLLAESDVQSAGKVLIGTVEGDLHDIGKNLVAMMLEGAGFDVVDAGIDVSPATFVALVEEHQPDVVGFSALLTTSMMKMKTTIEALVQAGLRDKVKVIVGGAPVTQKFADDIAADGYASNAASAVDLSKALIAGK